MKQILDQLGLADVNPGTWLGATAIEDKNAPLIESVNPATGEVIASVRSTTRDEYEQVVKQARAAYLEWRKIPAPARGEVVRLIGNALRENKDALGSLVTLEMGKIKAEGDGEVQEMIDICDFAVGQSRMLYGNSMHSERPQHRMYEQWHPLGPRRHYYGVQLSGSRMVLECLHCGDLRQRQYLETVAESCIVWRRGAEDL